MSSLRPGYRVSLWKDGDRPVEPRLGAERNWITATIKAVDVGRGCYLLDNGLEIGFQDGFVPF